MKRRTHSLIGIACALLAACSSAPVVPPVDIATLESRAASALASGDFLAAQNALQQLVLRTDGDVRRGYEIDLARAEIGLGNAEAALLRLEALVPPIPETLRPEIMAVRAEALFALGQTIAAVRLLVEREIWLDTPVAIRANQTLIWDGLAASAVPPGGLQPTGDATVDGWLALAPLAGSAADEAGFLAALLEWRGRFPGHPAATGILADRLAALRGDAARPARIALLLPLGGDGLLRLRAEAVRDGIFAAHLSTEPDTAPEILIYDTMTESSLAAYQSAQLAGADFIIGPLRDTEVDAILPAAGFVPTLALNYDTQNAVTPGNFFEFALSSSDEIEAIATRSIAEGKRTAVILHASNDRGYRLMNNFRDAFQARGGRVIAARAYVSQQSTAGPIEELLGITTSQQRYQNLRNNLGIAAIEFEPRRREDIDMIFLQADPATGPADASLLMPLLRGENAGDIPTYATPDVYDPSRERGDADLDGLIFPDLPLLIDPVGDAGTAADLLGQFRSQSASDYPRLFAFGYDAYRLAEAIYQSAGANWTLFGATGQLYLGDNGRIRRIVPFAQFSNGQPRAARPATDVLSLR